MKTLVAKYKGVCQICERAISPGQSINYHGKGRVEHVECSDADDEESANEDEAAGLEPGTLASDRRLARQGLSVIRFSSGAVMTQNSRGRCIDAPCCGCCS